MCIQNILFILIAYIIGSISSAIIVCKLLRLPDPRSAGSNNPGTTNVLRVGGKFPAILTLFGDVLKGVIAVLLVKYFNLPSSAVALVMFAVFLGHLYPVFFHFQGGKGVATTFGAMLAFSWQFGLLLVGIWLLVFFVSKVSSLSAIVASIAAIGFAWWLFEPTYSITITLMVALLLFRHRQNIVRLLGKQELKVW